MLKLANGQLIATDAPSAPVKAAKTSKANTMLVWQGPSVLDPSVIVGVFATFKSSNAKTGDMVQIAILRLDQKPLAAIQNGDDKAICGNCPHRRYTGGACYVNVGQGPQAIYSAYERGNVPTMGAVDWNRFQGRMVRFGSYGDPAAIPFEVLQKIASFAKGWTGYTHQLQHVQFDPRVLEFCMVSADTPKQAQAYHAQGYKTFRVKHASQPLMQGEIECLSDTHRISCQDCGLCEGANAQTSVAINVHGSLKSRYKGGK